MIADYVGAWRGFNRDVRLYLLTTALLGFTVFGGIYPVLFNLYLLRLGYGPEHVGTINSVFGLAFAVASLPAGFVSRRWGGRRTMVAGFAMATIALALLPIAEFVGPALRSGWLMACSFARAIGFALYWVNARPFLMGATTENERRHVYSVQGAIFPLTGFGGSLIAGSMPAFFVRLLGVSLADPAPYRYPLWIVPVLLLPGLAALNAIREFDTGQRPEQNVQSGHGWLALILVLSCALFLQVTTQSAVATFFNVYLDDALRVPTSIIGAISAASQLLSSASALVTPALARRWGNGLVFLWTSVGAALCVLPLALFSHWSATGLAYLGVMALYGMTFPAINVYQMELVSPGWRAAMSGATAMASGLSWSAASFVGGRVIASWGYRPFFAGSAALTLAGALLFWSYFTVPRGELARQAEAAD